MRTKLLTVICHGLRRYNHRYPDNKVFWRSWRRGAWCVGIWRKGGANDGARQQHAGH